ncbi:transporter substrate-binding domain-containing protein [Ochrobactrum sp. Marseille-Q0166]|uniref:transporter substrate-binding domain-containing protein n=1 Tax=Ochrobactrum sp. Marseille-Q0166 TaxID=2761105 RepID=UPI0016550F8F|nr:transporter substrate-binding domain-containing protein [Ochrobactrum sp. Marseille-Q0166]MBC8717715.1 transporter substrate-binding domain-containing protein [Ochrobactrum sp. Marseille-Q0166]
MTPPFCSALKSFFPFFILVISLIPANAQEAPLRQVKVGVYVSEPFVIKEGETYNGMAVDLWRDLGTRLGLVSQFVEYPNYNELVKAVSEKQVDAAVTNLTITESRAEVVDFTHPWFDAGLRIMIHKEAGNGWDDLIEGLEDAGHLATYAWIGIVILIATIALTIFDRRFDANFPPRWIEGLAESFYHVVSLATSGKSSRKNLFGWAGRIWQAFWLVFGIAVVAYVTSSVTSVMTVTHISNKINNLADLQNKTVGVRTGSIAQQILTARSISTVTFNHLPEAVSALTNDEISAIVGDSPVLAYYAHKNLDEPVEMVGNIFSPDKYGFAFPRNSDLVKPASVAIISLEENETLAALKEKYFGPDE